MMTMKQILLLLTWYDYRIHQGVAQVAREVGWQLIAPKNRYEQNQVLERWQGEGCITLIDDVNTLRVFQAKGIPCVELGLAFKSHPAVRLVIDNREIGRLAARHFLDHGYREVFVADPGASSMSRERYDSLRFHVESEGGMVTVLESTQMTWSSVLAELQEVARTRSTTLEELSIAFFAYSDYRASELISLCLREGYRVPENVAVLGVNNDTLVNEGLAVGLSSVDSDQEGLGRAAARLLQRIMENPEDAPDPTVIRRHPPKGVVTRKSTDCYAVRSPLVANALHWIHNHFHEGIQAIEVARAMRVTQQGLQKAFKLYHIRSPGAEIRHQRLHATAHYLVHTSERLAGIAERCGYTSVDTLIASFRREFGMPPGQYRKEKRVAL